MHNTAAGAANTYGEEKYEGASITAEAATEEHECNVCAAICTVRQKYIAQLQLTNTIVVQIHCSNTLLTGLESALFCLPYGFLI